MGLHCIYLLFITTLSWTPLQVSTRRLDGYAVSPDTYLSLTTLPLRPGAPGWSMAEAQTLPAPAPSGGVVRGPPRIQGRAALVLHRCQHCITSRPPVMFKGQCSCPCVILLPH